MNNLPRKSSKADFPSMPGLPAMFQNSMPPTIPQMPYKPGGIKPLLEGLFHNWKLLHLERASEREANIYANHTRKMRAQFEGISELLLFGQKYELQLQTIRNSQRMLDINEQKAEAELMEQNLKNYQLQAELQLTQLDLKIRLKEARDNGMVEDDSSE
jgi:hypothetical protein